MPKDVETGLTADMAVLLEMSAPGEAIRLPEGTSILGRGPECFIRVNDAAVSRRHAQLLLADNKLVLSDLDSRNGTWVNGVRLQGRQTLVQGDRITVGDHAFTVRFEAPASFEDMTPTGATGQTLPGMATMQPTCSRCGSLLPVEAERCPRCGAGWRSSTAVAGTEDHISVGTADTISMRRHPRYDVSLPVRYTSSTLTLDCVALDLSLGGVFLSTSRLDELGSGCSILISDQPGSLPTPDATRDGRVMSFRGVVRNVVHRGRTGMGIEFESLDSRQRSWIEQRSPRDPPVVFARVTRP